MNAINFISAYKQLSVFEREFVDGFLRSLEREAEKRFERLTTTLERVSKSLDPGTLDERTRDLFSKPLIVAAIRERTEELAAARDLTPDRIIREHAAMALANLDDYGTIGEDGLWTLDLNKCNRVQMSAIQQIEIEETYGRTSTRKIKFKLHNKQVSLEALGKFMGLDKADNAEYAAYKTLPADLVQLPNSASVGQLAEQYAAFIDG